MDSDQLGRLKRTLKDRCPDCGKVLQIRVREEENLLRGEIVRDDVEYIICSVQCGYEAEIKDPKKRKTVFDKTAFVKPAQDEKRGGNDRYSKPTGFTKSYSNTNRTSFAGNNKRRS